MLKENVVRSDMISALSSSSSSLGIYTLEPYMANAIRTELSQSQDALSDTAELIEALNARSMLFLGGCVLDYETAKEIRSKLIASF